jgi:selenocysteine lyase/cysteine desulfurase
VTFRIPKSEIPILVTSYRIREDQTQVRTRRDFLSLTGKKPGLAALSAAVASLLEMSKQRPRTSPISRRKERPWTRTIGRTSKNSFSVTRGIINLNNGGVSPSPRIVTEALVRYIWEQEDATAYTMANLSRNRKPFAPAWPNSGCDREEIAITRNASESLEILLMGMNLKPGDEILTTTQDYPRMLTTLRQREKREGPSLSSFRFRFRRRISTRSLPRLKKESPTTLASS